MFIITPLSNSVNKLQTLAPILSAAELSGREITTSASPDAAVANNVLESRGKISNQRQ